MDERSRIYSLTRHYHREIGTTMRRCFSYSMIARILGLLLLAAAALKLNGLAVDPVGRMGLFSMPAFQIGVTELELFLAGWLLWGKQPIGSWMMALGVFTVFAFVSAYQGWIGRASCGCFGQLSVSPWNAFGIDLTVLFALILGRPDLGPVWQQPRLLLKSILIFIYGMVGTVALLVALTSLASVIYGSPDAALAHFRGERISIYPRLVDVGTGDPGEVRETAVEVVNRTDRTLRLIGGTTD